MAMKYDAKIENTTPRARGAKMYLLTPLNEATGKKTMAVVKVAASTAIATSVPPFIGCNLRRFAHLHVAEDVFEHDHAVIDKA